MYLQAVVLENSFKSLTTYSQTSTLIKLNSCWNLKCFTNAAWFTDNHCGVCKSKTLLCKMQNSPWKASLGLDVSKPTLHEASTSTMVVEEVHRQVKPERCGCLSCQAWNNEWREENLERRNLSSMGLWEIDTSYISFIIITLSEPYHAKNLQQRHDKDPTCILYSTPVTLKHIFNSWKTNKATKPGCSTRLSRVWQQYLKARGISLTLCIWK